MIGVHDGNMEIQPVAADTQLDAERKVAHDDNPDARQDFWVEGHDPPDSVAHTSFRMPAHFEDGAAVMVCHECEAESERPDRNS